MPARTTPLLLLALCALLAPASCTPQADSPSGLAKFAGWSGVDPRSAGSFDFVVMSDNSGGHEPGMWESAVAEINLLRPEFVICVGDLIEGGSEDPKEIARMWDEMDAKTRRLEPPFFYVAGNHDVSNPILLKAYEARHGVNGKSYYSFNYKLCHFVVINSVAPDYDRAFEARQLAWLEQDLASAGSAEHVFVFFHYPQFSSPKPTALWQTLTAHLPPGRSTIFNGHWHNLSHYREGGIETYVLACTGAESSQFRPTGSYRMFAQVTVDRGRPTIALVPVQEIQPVSTAEDAVSMRKVPAALEIPAVPNTGGKLLISHANPLQGAMAATFSVKSPDWQMTPAKPRLEIPPGESASVEVELKPTVKEPGKPEFAVWYDLTNVEGKSVSVEMDRTLTLCGAIDIPRVQKIQLDGALDDWKDIKPLSAATKDCIFGGAGYWKDAADASFELRAATDGKTLFVAVDVNDNQFSTDLSKDAWLNDAVEFFWDARAPKDRDGKHGQGTGQVIFVVPEKSDEPVVKYAGDPPPLNTDPKAALKRRSGGYVMEFAIPLEDLGYAGQAKPGEGINIEIQLDDRDIEKGSPVNTYMTTFGAKDSYLKTSGYVRGTFK